MSAPGRPRRRLVVRRRGPAPRTAAIYYAGDGYRVDGRRLLGRQVAGAGFLEALVRHGTADPLFCFTSTRQGFEAFTEQVRPWVARSRTLRWLPAGDVAGVAQAGTLYRPDPMLGRLAWARRRVDQRSFSLCGVTHTVADLERGRRVRLAGRQRPGDLAHAAMATAVDVGAGARALTALIGDPSLRRALGENGRRRAREVYDWSRVVGAYEALWSELAEVRASAAPTAPVCDDGPAHPLCDDPFRVFAHYTGEPWSEDWPVRLGASADPERRAELRAHAMTAVGSGLRLPEERVESLVATVWSRGTVSARELIETSAGGAPGGRKRAVLTLLQLAKFDVLRIGSAVPGPPEDADPAGRV